MSTTDTAPVTFRDLRLALLFAFPGEAVTQPRDDEAIVTHRLGWTASITRDAHSYGGAEGLFEVMAVDAAGRTVAAGDGSGVTGWLTVEQVVYWLREVNARHAYGTLPEPDETKD